MIELTYKELMNADFARGVKNLTARPFPGEVAYRIRKIAVELDKAVQKAREDLSPDLKSELVKAQGKNYPEDKLEKLQKKMDVYDAKTVKIKQPKLAVKHLNQVNVSAVELMALSPILDESEWENGKSSK